jgi:hypothetical protein
MGESPGEPRPARIPQQRRPQPASSEGSAQASDDAPPPQAAARRRRLSSLWHRYVTLALTADPFLAVNWVDDDWLRLSINDWDGPQSYRF